MAETGKDLEQQRLESQAAIDELFDICYREGIELLCLQLVDFGISQNKIDLMIKVYMSAENEVIKMSGILPICETLAGKGASVAAIETVIAKCLELGEMKHLPVLLGFAGRGLTAEEIKSLHKFIPDWIKENQEFLSGLREIHSKLGDLNESIGRLSETIDKGKHQR